MKENEFEGRTAFVTAAGAGIGRAVVLEYLSLGGSVVATDIRKDLVDQIKADAGAAGERVLALELDAADQQSILRAYSQAIEFSNNGIDSLFNVAGINTPRNIVEMEEAEWDRLFDINLKSIFRLGKLMIPDMLAVVMDQSSTLRLSLAYVRRIGVLPIALRKRGFSS